MNPRLQEILNRGAASWREYEHSGRERITIVHDTSSIARGAEETIAKIREVVAARNLDVDIQITGSWGMNWMEPMLTVRSAAGTRRVLYGNVTADRVEEFIQRTIVEQEDMPELAVGIIDGNSTPEIPLLADHPWMKGQIRRLMANLGTTDPENIDNYIAHGGYEGLGAALDMDPADIIQTMIDSGLGGRGGGGFPTGRKWDFLRNANVDPKYLICNADEGDPGAWVNRVLMEGDPHLIVEGMLIGAKATGAREGYIYIRHEYPLAVERMRTAVRQAYEYGLLGEDILGTGMNFDLIVFVGAGAYVCGEETGLINSIDGFRGMPRIKPPFPAQAGLWNKPTNVNNVESYANAPLIFRNGGAWWSNVSDIKEKGTKMFTFSGQVNWPSCIEIPFGPSIEQVLNQYAGGMNPGSTLKGYQPGGPLSGMLPAREANLTLTLDPYRERGMFLGSGGIIFFDQNTSIVDLCTFFLGFCEDESCGRCTTCHGGNQRIVEILRRIGRGGGRVSDLDKLESLIGTLVWSNCLHGQFSPTTVKLALRYFRDEFEYVIKNKRDPAHSLPDLLDYRVTSQADTEALEAARDICPTNAISAEGGQYSIDDGLCIRCGACKELAPASITVSDRFGDEPVRQVPSGVAVAAGG